MASFSSVLSSIGHGLKAFFTNPAVGVVEGIGISITETMFPALTPLLTGVTAAVGKAEALAAAAGVQNGTGAQKLALALSDAEAVFNAYETARGINIAQSSKENIVNQIVGILNELDSPAPTA